MRLKRQHTAWFALIALLMLWLEQSIADNLNHLVADVLYFLLCIVFGLFISAMTHAQNQSEQPSRSLLSFLARFRGINFKPIFLAFSTLTILAAISLNLSYSTVKQPIGYAIASIFMTGLLLARIRENQTKASCENIPRRRFSITTANVFWIGVVPNVLIWIYGSIVHEPAYLLREFSFVGIILCSCWILSAQLPSHRMVAN